MASFLGARAGRWWGVLGCGGGSWWWGEEGRGEGEEGGEGGKRRRVRNEEGEEGEKEKRKKKEEGDEEERDDGCKRGEMKCEVRHVYRRIQAKRAIPMGSYRLGRLSRTNNIRGQTTYEDVESHPQNRERSPAMKCPNITNDEPHLPATSALMYVTAIVALY